jgi:hypothetical protein
MRPLKFRARINEKGRAEHLAEWQHFTLDDLLDGHARELDERIDRKTIGQFTGLHDKNGKEVYADDNIGSPDRAFVARVFQVEGGKDHGQWCCQHKDGDIQTLYDALYGDGFEVIGDIFEGEKK